MKGKMGLINLEKLAK